MKRSLKRDTLGHGNNSRLIEVVCTHEGNDVFSMHLLTSVSILLTYIWFPLLLVATLIVQYASVVEIPERGFFFSFILMDTSASYIF